MDAIKKVFYFYTMITWIVISLLHYVFIGFIPDIERQMQSDSRQTVLYGSVKWLVVLLIACFIISKISKFQVTDLSRFLHILMLAICAVDILLFVYQFRVIIGFGICVEFNAYVEVNILMHLILDFYLIFTIYKRLIKKCSNSGG